MTTKTAARHRKASRPVTPLTNALPTSKRGMAIAASSGLALTVIASGATAAGTATQVGDSAGSLKDTGLAVIADGAREAVATNAVLSVPTDTQWDADVPTVEAQAPVGEVAQSEPEAQSSEGQTTAGQGVQADGSSVASASVAAPAPAGSSAVAIASQFVGYPYVWGAASPGVGFDCSGLVSYVYGQMGIALPHSSGGIYGSGTVISASEAQPGDVVWWPGHVGIYAGNGMMVDAVDESSGVMYHSVYGGATFLRF
ncbi:C40 family peptidase [Actinomyces vulturis]|uniref:C40 family peptidase n=1 Tax=Actinomyces vulturis TaxID=1857645 RepID=UPI00082C5BA9|nr:C40 family peptidase [Actinomyces vulturis]